MCTSVHACICGAMNLFDLSAILLVLFTVLSMVDGVYLHLFKFKLHGRQQSRREHVIHGIRGLLLVPTLLFVLSGTTSGWVLWLGIAFVLADVIVTIADVREERGSRAFQGGLPTYELGLHIALTMFHLGAIAASLAARPAAAWWGETSTHVADARFAELVAVHGMLGGTILVTVIHAVLLHRRFVVSDAAASAWSVR